VQFDGMNADDVKRLKELERAAADVEHQLSRLEPDAAERVLVGGDLLVLAQPPVRRACAPQRPPALGAAREPEPSPVGRR